MKAVAEECGLDGHTCIYIKLGEVSPSYADEICRGVQSYLDLISELETE